eukprot:11272695-Alexandrium_andersonii.AAC.1
MPGFWGRLRRWRPNSSLIWWCDYETGLDGGLRRSRCRPARPRNSRSGGSPEVLKSWYIPRVPRPAT